MGGTFAGKTVSPTGRQRAADGKVQLGTEGLAPGC